MQWTKECFIQKLSYRNHSDYHADYGDLITCIHDAQATSGSS